MSAKVQLIISSLIAHIGAALKNQIARRGALVPADEWLLSPIYWAESHSTPSLGLRRRGSKKHKGEWNDVLKLHYLYKQETVRGEKSVWFVQNGA